MIRRLRRAIPAVLILGVAFAAALTVMAQVAQVVAPQPQYATTGEVHRFVVWAFLVGAGTVIAGLWVIYVRDQRALGAKIDALAGSVRAHHENWAMHPAGSEKRIDRFDRKLDEQSALLTGIQNALTSINEGQKRLVRDSEDQEDRLRVVEDSLRDLHKEHDVMHGRVIVNRDPMQSPHKRRSTDPQEGGENGSGDDYRIQRGQHK